jgi:peroxiredoxin
VLQVVDLQNDGAFKALGVELVSIAPDSLRAWREAGTEYELEDLSTVASDRGNEVSAAYDVLKWSHPVTGEPGHTFVLVGEDGRVEWIKDYGAEEHGSVMYVMPFEIVRQLRDRL